MKDFAPDDDTSFIDATERLFAIREGGTQVSALTSELISFEDINQQKAFFNLKRNAALIHKNFITCLGKINKSLDEEKCPQMLIVGTEHQQMILLEPNGQKVKVEVALKSVPVFILADGQFDVDYRIFLACRDGRVYIYRAGKISDHEIGIESKPVGLVKFEKSILIAGMDCTLQSFYLKGKKNWSITMPAEICTITKMEHSRAASKNNVLVALKNGTIRLYNEKNLINEVTTEDTCNGLVYGIFGREDGCMVINHQSGGMQAKILQRQANLSVSTVKAGAPPEQDIPLKVPQKTTLFVELT